jgi:hypothetical protein
VTKINPGAGGGEDGHADEIRDQRHGEVVTAAG